MQQVKLANALLWTFNVVIGIAVVLFAFQFLLFPKKKTDLGIEVEEGTVGEGTPRPQPNYGLLGMLPNPFTKESGGSSKNTTETVAGFPPGLKLKGALGTTAFFERDANATGQADIDGPLYIHEPNREYVVDGWTLISIESETATFRDRMGQTQIVRTSQDSGGITTTGDTRGGRNWAGTPYDPARFKKSRKVSEGGDREMWEVDPEEGAWLNQNFEAAMSQCQYRPHVEGGLEITYVEEGSIGVSRGLKTGDIIKNVNGIQIRSIEDLRAVQAKSGKATTTSLIVHRGGASYTIVYKLVK